MFLATRLPQGHCGRDHDGDPERRSAELSVRAIRSRRAGADCPACLEKKPLQRFQSARTWPLISKASQDSSTALDRGRRRSATAQRRQPRKQVIQLGAGVLLLCSWLPEAGCSAGGRARLLRFLSSTDIRTGWSMPRGLRPTAFDFLQRKLEWAASPTLFDPCRTARNPGR